jgi:hypothetical protein
VNKPPFDFQTQLTIGEAGEDFLIAVHPWLRRPTTPERRFDLIDQRPPFKRVEVKTDMWPHNDTPNFFWEKSTVIHGRKAGGYLPGGPWRAQRDDVDTLVYLFSNGGTKDAPQPPIGYWFNDIPALVAALDALILRRPRVALPRRIRSLRVSSQGYLVPRELLADVPGAERVEYEREVRP